MLFAIFNTFIGFFVVTNRLYAQIASFVVFLTTFGSIIHTTFIYDNLEMYTILSLVIALVYIILLVPLFG